jgi:aspartyl protease family protein
MPSATTSLFASFALAGAGAAGLVYTLTHPGIVAGALDHAFAVAGFENRPAAPRADPANDAESTDDERQVAPVPAGRAVSLPAGHNGHFLTTAQMNGRNVAVMVDTGASLIALTYEDAERAGVFVNPSDFTGRAMTANGVARVAPVTIARVQIGNITLRNVEGAVSERGASERSLLGMSFLGRLSRVEMRGSTLVLQE